PLPASRPGTPASLGVAGSSTNTQPTVRSVSGSSSVSAKAGVAPCFHTTRPQFITSHIERCEACRLKYARQAEAATIPYTQLSMRRSGAAPPPRSASRQSVGSTAGTGAANNSTPSTPSSSGSGGNRPTSSASVIGLVSSSNAAIGSTSNVTAAPRPSSRASAMSTAARTRSATRHHNRSSSAASSLVDAKSATRRAVAQTAEEALLLAEGSAPPGLFALPPPVRNDYSLSAISSSDSAPGSPTDSIAARTRAPASIAAAAAAAGSVGARPIARSSTKPNAPLPRDASFNEARRASSHSIHAHSRRTGNESPVSYMRSSRKSGGAMSLASFSNGTDNDGEQAVDLTSALMGSLVDRTRDFDKMKEEYEAKIARLQDDILRMRRQNVRPPTEPEFHLSTAPMAVGNIFSDPEGSAARLKSLAHTIELDKAALDKFDEFRKSYEDCEPSLRSNRAQFSGERPLSPPPARGWGSGGGSGSVTNTPMRLADSSSIDHEARLASLNAAEVRRAGEDLMSTPVRRKTQRTIRATSTRRPTKSRMNRPMFTGIDSEMSDDAVDHDDDFDDDDDDHRDLRNCLMSASKFGTFLVQYVTRQCLDYNSLCDENKMLLVRHDELEKRTAHLEKLNKRLEESRDDQAAQTYDISAQREMLVDKVEAADRTNRRLGNEIDKLKNDLVASNERGVGLDDQVNKLNASLAKGRQRYEQEIANLRRSSNALQQDKSALTKKNDELRVELKGKLQRAGLKANVDEYLAERKRESAAAAAVSLATELPASKGDQQDNAVADHEIKRLQETVQFWRKKTDRMNRKLRAEKVATIEAQRSLRAQQEETYRYQQAFGPLPDDIACDTMETLGDFMPSSLLMDGLQRPESLAAPGGKPIDSGAESDALSAGSSDDPDDISQQQLLLQTQIGDDSDSASDSNGATLQSVAKSPRVGSQSGGESSNGEDADARDIRRYEQRLRNRRANMATTRSRRPSFAKSNSVAGSGRRNKSSALSIDVGVAGESLGDILGADTQWGEPVSARGAGSLRGVPTSLAAELGALDAGALLLAPSSPKRLLGNASPTWRPRTRSSRGLPSPFGDTSGGFGISYGESVSLAEQLAAAAPAVPRVPIVERPKMVDVSTSTDLLPAHRDAVVDAVTSSTASAVVAVQAALGLPSTDVAVGTASTEPDATRTWGTQPLVSALSLVEGSTQTQATATSDFCTQAVASTADQQSGTDPSVGVRHVGAEMVAAATETSIQTELVGVDMATGTDVSVFAVGHRGVDNAALSIASGVQAAAEYESAQVATDKLFGTREASTSSGVVNRDQSGQAVPEQADCGVFTERMFGTTSQGIEAVALQRDFGVLAGSAPLRDAEVATQGPELVERGVATVARPTTETSVATLSLETRDSQTTADDVMFSAWLAPLIPAGISADTVFAALSRQGEPVHELHARQVAEAARAAAAADHERLAALAAEEAALNVKVYADKSVSPQVPTSEQSVQAKPCLVSRYAQAGVLSVADAGVDPRAGPVLLSVGISTECQSTTRWVEPFDPVAKASKHVDAVAATADCATSHGIELASASAGPVCELKDSAVSAIVSARDQYVDTAIVLQHAATDSTVECRDEFVAVGLSATSSVGVSVATPVADRAAGSSVETTTRSTSNAVATDTRYTGAGIAGTRGVGTDMPLAVSTMATGPTSSWVDRGTGPDLDGVCTDVSVGPDQATTSDVMVDTVADAVGVLARGVGIDAPLRTTDAHVQAGLPLANATTATVASTATASVFVDALSIPSQSVATVEAGMATSPMAEHFGVDAVLEPRLLSDKTTVFVAEAGPVVAVDTLSVLSERLVSPVLSHKTAPSLPLPPLPAAVNSRSPSLPGTLRRLPTALDLSADEQSDSRSVPVNSKPRRESNGEDYGYIMVSPRTNVQRVPVSSLSSLRSDSIADTTKSNRSVASRPLGLGMFGQQNTQLAADVHSEVEVASVYQGQDIGPDYGGEDDDDDSDREQDEVMPMSMGRSDRLSGDAGVGTSSGLEFSMRASMSIGVETTDHMDQFVSRQPEPLIVQSIARTMVGTFMHKYTPTRFTHSSGRERRHLRYFWIHPYAKMLNWSKQPPSGGTGLSRNTRDGGSRSVYMRSIRIVQERPTAEDESAGEPEYCIVVRTDHREIKVKATTQADHDLWYMAMSYLQSRRIITSSTYRTLPMSGSANHHQSGGYNSDHSMRSRGTTVGSVDSNQRVILDADRRHRTSERSRSRSRSRPRGVIPSDLDGRPPVPSLHSVDSASAHARGDVPLPPLPTTAQAYAAFSHTSNSSQANSGHLSGSTKMTPQQQQRATMDLSPSRGHSLQTTPRSLRPVSMMPTSTTPGSTAGEGSKRLSVGLLRRMGGGSGTSLFRHGSQMSDDSQVSSPPLPPVRDDLAQPQSIAAAMMNRLPAPTGRGALPLMSGSNTVRKMFSSASFLRALRSRDSIDDPEA
ncbi:hypothetical protein H4R27_004958, partial [Coemansia aciculifera]